VRLPQPRSVRHRLLTVVVISVAAALAAMTVGFNVLLWHSLSGDATSVVHSRAMAEASSVDLVNDTVVAPEPPSGTGFEGQSWVFVRGVAIEKPRVNPDLDRAALEVAATPGVAVDVPGQHARLYATPAVTDGRVVGTVVAGVSLAPYERTQRIALLGSIALAAAAIVVVALIARWMLTAALQPVARMTADAEVWSVNEPERRFAVGRPYDELSQLAATLDGLLDRLSASLRREQRFSAELSHELRTPLANVIAEAELSLRRDRQTEAYKESLTAVLRSARQMSRAVDTLLLAAQQESGLARGRADAGAVLEEVASTCERLAGEHGVAVAVDVPARPASIGVEADVAAQVLQPIVENACRHARHTVRVSSCRMNHQVVVTVVDDGPGVAADEVERIFEPGVRGAADNVVAPRTPGAGLGLALARRLARAAGGDVEARADGDGGRFIVRFPAG
jgi:signal transduction histidine kinase